ncbi:hypothetical protein [Pedobacter sp. W3I1]|uniref:hypothetical protein n=1 Tax=Pedobacter sp. W3I1 TaxID=3042291 RepID=UPI0027D8FA7B|nr:hypothetical protein [Pedobacter sp. W3I1]
MILITGLCIFNVHISQAQTDPDYEELSLFLKVQRVGAAEIPALIKGETAYLPVISIFNFLKLNIISKNPDSVSGTFIDPGARFFMDPAKNRIIYRDKVYPLKQGDLISTATELYLRTDYFGEIFGLNCTFNFRNLSVILNTDLELPILRELRLEQMRTNLSRLKGEFKADTVIGRNYPLFYFGAADYAVITSAGNKDLPKDARVSLGLGGMLAGGETNVVLNYHNNEKLNPRQQYYLWRYVDNNGSLAKQFLAGKIQGRSIASIYAPIIGIQVTNAPTTYRRSFGTYTLSNHTEPNWTVELYVNGVLINYVKADASGFYTFDVPLVYGNTVVKLRFYGPYGEERSTEQNINIPFNFLPKDEFEYFASTGIVEDANHTRFARFSSNYGISKNVTVGGGIEYLSSISSGTKIPFINTSVRLLPNLLASGEYDHNVRSKALLSYNLPSGLQLELNNTWYKKGQTAINNTFVEDRKAILSFPIRTRSFSAYTRITVQQLILPNTKYTTAEWMLSATLGNFNGSVTTYSYFLKGTNPDVFSNFSLSTRLLKNLLITQQAQFNYVDKSLIAVKTEIEKRVFRNGYINAVYERNFNSHINNIELGVRYDFSFALTRLSVRKSNDEVRMLHGLSGSLIHDSNSGFTNFNNHSSIGQGSILLIPYLDLNGNNRQDKSEPRVQGLKIKINGGRITQSIRDTTIRITDLEAYTNYNLELDSSGFDRLAWKLPKKNYNVIIDPNYVKNIAIPIVVYGEASGRVILKEQGEDKGQGGLIINFYNERSVKIGQTISEVDGYFSYLGFFPGKYTAKIDPGQLEKLHLIASPGSTDFTILRSIDGTLISNLLFNLAPSTTYKRAPK